MASLIGESVGLTVRFSTFADTGFIDVQLVSTSFTVTSGTEVSQAVSTSYQGGGFTQTFSGTVTVNVTDAGFVVGFSGTAQPGSVTYRLTSIADQSAGAITSATQTAATVMGGVSGTLTPTFGATDGGFATGGFSLFGFQPGTNVSQTVAFGLTDASAPPVVSTNLGVTVLEGDIVTILASRLDTTDADTPDSQIVYRVTSATTNGTLFRDSNGNNIVDGGEALGVNATFTQTDINSFAIRYAHSGNELASDSFGFSVSDTVTTVSGNTFAISVTPVNDTPTLSGLNGDVRLWTETLGLPVGLDDGLNATIADPDDANLNGGNITVAVASGARAGDLLSVASIGFVQVSGSTLAYNGNVIGTISGGTDGNALVVTFISALATLSVAQDVLRAIQFDHTSPDPGSSRTLSVTVNDGSATSAASLVSISLVGVNDAPTIVVTPTDPTFTEDGSAVGLFNGASISTGEAGQNIVALALTVSGLQDGAAEQLSIDGTTVALTAGASGTTAGNGLSYGVSLSGGTATVNLFKIGGVTPSQAAAVVNGLAYSVTGDTPSAGNRVVTLTSLIDSGGTSGGGSDTRVLSIASTVTVAPVNDAPTVVAPATIGVTEDTALALTGISFADVDAGGASVTATLSVDAGVLTATSGSGVTISGSGSGSLTLAGTLTDINAFIAALSVTYTPPADRDTDATLSVSINDGGNTGGAAQTGNASVALVFTAVNDAPVLTAPATLSVIEDTPPAAIAGLSVADVDAGTGAITVTLSVDGGTLAAADAGGVTVSRTPTALTLTGTLADINAYLADPGTTPVTFSPDPDSNAAVTLTVDVDDGGATGSGGAQTDQATVVISIDPVDDPSTAADDAVSTPEDTVLWGNVLADNGSGPDTDVDSPLSITAVNGDTGAVGVAVTLASGALVTVNTDGTFDYDPNGKFDTLPVGGTATDSFAYTLNGADVATVTVTITGVDSNDLLLGTVASDNLSGGIGFDTLYGDDGNDLLVGGADGDFLYGQNGDDTIEGGDGNDVAAGGPGADSLDGGTGVDWLTYAFSTTAVNVNLAANAATGGHADGDTIVNFENVIGTDLNDVIIGDAADNLIRGGAGADTLGGGAGQDWLDYRGSFAAGVNVNLATGAVSGGDAEGDVISGFERIIGSGNADVLVGNAGGNVIRGSLGADTMDGGAGVDWLDYRDASAGVIVLLATGSGFNADAQGDVFTNFEFLMGSFHNDLLVGDGGENLIRGGAGADTMDGGAGIDWLDYRGSLSGGVSVNMATGFATGGDAEGDTFANFERVIGTGDNDTLTGNALDNHLYGMQGDDRLDGGEGNDFLRADAGDDVFIFGAGSDTMDGGLGYDIFGVSADSTDFAIVDNGGGSWQVTHLATGDVDVLISVEALHFDDTILLPAA